MVIGIIGAMEIEIASLKNMLKSVSEQKISSITYYNGNIGNKNVVLARCGAGKVNAAICTQSMILKYNPDIIINIGVAGGLNPNLNIGDIVVSDNVVQHDMDTSAVGDPIGFISGINVINIQSSPHIVKSIASSANKLNNVNVYVGTVASGDQFVVSDKQKKFIYEQFNAMCAEMEGAAVGHVCYMNNVDFCIIRSISDNADHSAPVDFNSFVKIAAKNSTDLMLNFLNSF